VIIGPGKTPLARVALWTVTLDQTSQLTTITEGSRAEEPIRRNFLTDDLKGGTRAECEGAPRNGYKKQSDSAKLQHPEEKNEKKKKSGE
jgi:hypothetical protein